MTERGLAEVESLPGAGDRKAGAWRSRLALVAGSTTALITGEAWPEAALGFLNKSALPGRGLEASISSNSRRTATRTSTRCTFGEGLSAGKVPYFGHPVEYPVLIGGAMQAVAWVVRPITNPYVRGREFFDVTRSLLSDDLRGRRRAGQAYLAGRSRRWIALGVALAPALILSSFINWI